MSSKFKLHGIYLDPSAGDRYIILAIDGDSIMARWLGDDGMPEELITSYSSCRLDEYLGQATELQLALL